jgi:putative membrane protein
MLIFAFGLLNNHRNLATYTFWCLFVFFGIYLIEVIGINTGYIYGSYTYGNALPTQIANVPLIASLNWTMLILSCYGFFSKIIKNRFVRAFAGSASLVLLDIFMEPVAVKLNYWTWEFKTPPLHNYFAWFLISLLFSTFLAILKIHARSAIFRIYLVMQFLFFILLNIFM